MAKGFKVIPKETPKDSGLASSSSISANASDQLVPVAGLIATSGAGMHEEEVKLTRAMVLKRLEISSFPATVGLANLSFCGDED